MSPANKGMQYPIDPYTREEVDALVAAVSPRRRRTPRRTRAMLVLMWRTGLRIGECCSASLHDLRLDQPGRPNSLRVQLPKGARNGTPPREVGLDEVTCDVLRRWIEMRGTGPGFLFSTYTGAKLDTSYMRRTIPLLAKLAGITRRCHAHAFRHTFCRELGDEQVDIVHRMEALGHSSLGVTTRYAKSCGDSPVVAIMAGRAT